MYATITATGRLTHQPALTYLQSGTALTVMSLAVDNPRRKGKDKTTSFFSIKTFGKTAESCAQYLEKGQTITVIGAPIQERWEKDGQKREKIVIVANTVQFGQKAKNTKEVSQETPAAA